MDRFTILLVAVVLSPTVLFGAPPTALDITPQPGSLAARACGVDQIVVEFSEDVDVVESDFAVITQETGEHSFTLGYDPLTHIATLDLLTALPDIDRIRLMLSGSIRSFSSGSRLGDDANFFFATLGGDVNESGDVTMADVEIVRNFFNDDAAAEPDKDLNCNSFITVADMVIAVRRLNNELSAPALAALRLDPGEDILLSGGSIQQLSVTGLQYDGSESNLTAAATGTGYDSSEPSVATVNSDGLVTAFAAGMTTITATNGAASDDVKVWVGSCSDSSCEDGNPCTADLCDPALGCSHEIDGDLCDDVFAPEVLITVQPPVVNVGNPVTITVEVFDDVGVASRALTVNDMPVALDADNQAVFTPDAPGTYLVRADVTDLVGRMAQSTADFYAQEGDVDRFPTVAITSPAPDSELSVPTDIVGTASDGNLFKYTLAYRLVGDGEFITFKTVYESVAGGVLGTLDTTKLVNGCYIVRLSAQDTSGQISQVELPVVVSGNMKVGNFTISFNDLTVPVSGIPITVTRTYDSRVKARGDFGVGWSLDLASLKLEENQRLGDDWQQSAFSVPPFNIQTRYVMESVGPRTVSLTWPDGRLEQFAMTTVPSKRLDVPFTLFLGFDGIAFDPIGTTTSTLAPVGADIPFFNGSAPLPNGTPVVADLVDDSSFLTYDPDSYVLTTLDGRQLTFVGEVASRVSRLVRIEDLNGNTVDFSDNGVFHSSGKNLRGRQEIK